VWRIDGEEHEYMCPSTWRTTPQPSWTQAQQSLGGRRTCGHRGRGRDSSTRRRKTDSKTTRSSMRSSTNAMADHRELAEAPTPNTHVRRTRSSCEPHILACKENMFPNFNVIYCGQTVQDKNRGPYYMKRENKYSRLISEI
jgi:hypothetical protein